MPNLPSIFMITHGLGLEGAPRNLVNVAKGLAEIGQWHVVVFSHVDGPLRAELETAGISVFVLKSENPLPLMTEVTDLERYCRENMRFLDLSSKAAFARSISTISAYISRFVGFVPDIVLTNTVLGFWGVELARMWNVPSIWCIHESESPFSHLEWLPDDIFATLPNLLATASKVVFVAKATQDVFAHAGYTFNGTVIPNGLSRTMPVFSAQSLNRKEVRNRLGIENESVCILVLGSVFERKGQTDICQAIGLLPEKALARVKCLIVGDRPGTPYSRILHDSIRELAPEARNAIQIHSETQDTAPYYQAADIFVLCSRMESYPFVILEAMAMGLPIITTPVFGLREQLSVNQALFYAPGDIPSLAKHLTELVSDQDLRETLGASAKTRYANLPTYDDMLFAYGSLLKENMRQPR